MLRPHTLLLLFLAPLRAIAAGNNYAHSLQKIWYYQCYNLAWDLYGSAQNTILPFLPRANVKNTGNRGSLADGQLNFAEFMDHIGDKHPGFAAGRGIPLSFTIDPVQDGADFNALLEIMVDGGFGGEIPVGIASNTGPGTSTSKMMKFNDFNESLNSLVDQARKKGLDSELQSQMRVVASRIVASRRDDMRQVRYLGDNMATTFGFPKTTSGGEVQYPTIASDTIDDPSLPPASGNTVKVVNVEQTMLNPDNIESIKAHFGLTGDTTNAWQNKFKAWAEDYGANPFKLVESDYTEASQIHKSVLIVAERALEVLNRKIC
ncbi:hypothetical protein BX600DRAFT_437217 [Xylariales sp. PMI_506]|nr:hypothetical protein BX600DRAFT_437217 [Xylariales sp. PMI_506]